METQFKISIPKPCHENWDGMTTTTTGRFCGSCTKNVVDFTNKLPIEIQQYFADNKEQSICGRFKNEQLETIVIQVPSSVLYNQVSFHKAFLLALFVAMGTTLFGCKNENGDSQKIGEVVVVDSLKDSDAIKGVLLPPRIDTNDVSRTIGIIVTKDTLHQYHKKTEPKNFIKSLKTKLKDKSLEVMGDTIIQNKEHEFMGKPAIEEQPKSEK